MLRWWIHVFFNTSYSQPDLQRCLIFSQQSQSEKQDYTLDRLPAGLTLTHSQSSKNTWEFLINLQFIFHHGTKKLGCCLVMAQHVNSRLKGIWIMRFLWHTRHLFVLYCTWEFFQNTHGHQKYDLLVSSKVFSRINHFMCLLKDLQSVRGKYFTKAS